MLVEWNAHNTRLATRKTVRGATMGPKYVPVAEIEGWGEELSDPVVSSVP